MTKKIFVSKKKEEFVIGKQNAEFITERIESLSEQMNLFNESTTKEWKVITPEFAKEVLEKRNKINRAILQGTVNSYAKQMREGKWKTNGEPIIFSEEYEVEEDGVKRNVRFLLDGQHRLAACVKCGIPFLVLVVSGLPKEVFDSIDTGKVRAGKDALSAAHVFKPYGLNDSEVAITSAVIKKVLEFTSGRKGSHGASATRIAPNNSEIVNEAKAHSDVYASIVNELNKWRKDISVEDWFTNSKRMNAWFMAWLIINCGWSEGEVFYFFKELLNKKHQTSDIDTDPIEKLKERVKIHVEKNGRRDKSPYTDIDMYDFYARAWNAYITKKPLASMSRRKDCADFLEKEKVTAKAERTKAKLELEYALVATE